MKNNLYNTQKKKNVKDTIYTWELNVLGKRKSEKRAACGDLLARGKGLRMWSDNLLTEESQ